MNTQDLNKVRDEICKFCFDYCDFMKNSDNYHVCSLHKKKNASSECKLWDFLRWLYKNNEEEVKDNE